MLDPSTASRERRFQLEARHRMILRHAFVQWNDRPGWLHPVPGIDPKRPYDDNCYVEFALAMIVGLPVDEAADRPISPEVEAEMLGLHLSTQEAVQVLLRHGAVAPGSYELRDWRWRLRSP